MASPGKTHFDIVIIGAGMVGASMACALLPMIRSHHLKVALVEAFPLPEKNAVLNFESAYDDRSTALSYGSRCIYERLGIWSELKSHATPIKQIHVSDRGHFGSARLNASEHGIDALGYVIANAWLGRSLLHYLFEQNAVDYICPATVEKLTPGGKTVELKLAIKAPCKKRSTSEITTITADLVIVADGGRSDLNKQLNIDTEQRDYQQTAIIANVSSELAHQSVAYERFTLDGPVALLPLNDPDSQIQNRSSLVFTVANEQLDSALSMSDEEFIQLLQTRFGFRLGAFNKVGQRSHFPLMLRRAKEQILPGVAVIGNSAHTLHPIAGQGFNLALRGVYELAECLSEAATNGQPIGGYAVLDKYLQQRDRDQSKTIGFTDQAVRLFTNDDLLLSKIRDAGLIALDLFPLAKRLFGRQAMGLGDRLPPAH